MHNLNEFVVFILMLAALITFQKNVTNRMICFSKFAR